MSERSGFLALLGDVRREVDVRLRDAWRDAETRHAPEGDAVRAPLVAARDLCLRGGKRLRAALVVTGHRVAGGSETDSPWDAAVAVELLQSYFLIHDDWMDADRTRRGGPAVHAALEDAGYGVARAAAGAVLAGDYALALATAVLARGLVEHAHAADVLAAFAQMQLDAVVGQQLDVLGEGVDVERVYQLKTASYTVRGPLELGATWAGAGSGLRRSLERYATPLGVAFQLRDDLIGAYSNESASGKPRGSDLRAGKATLLVRLALERGSSSDRALVQGVLGRQDASHDAVEAALLAMERCGARRGVEGRIADLVKQAREALAAAKLAPRAAELLSGVVDALVDRHG